jgi:hypothetical protein
MRRIGGFLPLQGARSSRFHALQFHIPGTGLVFATLTWLQTAKLSTALW